MCFLQYYFNFMFLKNSLITKYQNVVELIKKYH
jgi:hypothetical protein